MASVTFLSSVGGDNSTVTDDTNPTTGLGNGGHRLRFIPALAQLVAIAANAVASATSASTSAGTATTQAGNASTSATNANNSFLNFDKRYLGSKTGDPSLDNQGNTLLTGAIYWNSSSSQHRVYNGSSWSNVVASSGAFADNNFIISDNVDSTKKVNFEVSGVGSGTTVTLTIPNGSGTLLTSGGGYATLASPTFTGTVTTPTVTTTGATGLSLTNGTSNLISFNVNGLGAPTFTTRSVGTKVLLYPALGASSVDYAIGVEAGNGYLWQSVPVSSSGFKWYAGNTLVATLTGIGHFYAVGDINGSDGHFNKLNAPATGYAYFGNSNTRYFGYDGINLIAVGAPFYAYSGISTPSTITTTSTDITTTTPTRIAVESGSDSTIRWQTPANFFNKVGQQLHLNANQGRNVGYLSYALNEVLVAGKMYDFYYPQSPNALTMPDTSTSKAGDIIVLAAIDDTTGIPMGWSSEHTLTLLCPTGVRIHEGASGESFVLDNGRVKMLTLKCTYNLPGSSSMWAIG